MFGKIKSASSKTPQKSQETERTDPSIVEDTDIVEDTESVPAPPLKPFSRKGSHAPIKPPTAPTFQPEIARHVADAPSAGARRSDRAIIGALNNGESTAKKLVVGREISLTGDITACDKLVVEGIVEVNLPNARIIEVSPTGQFTGNAEVQEADISGRFDGELIAHEKVTVRAGGHIRGLVRYGKIVIEPQKDSNYKQHCIF